jgi:urease accessory protein
MRRDLTVWQLCDSAFPAGALAHSNGLVAAWQAGEVVGAEGLGLWARTMLGQAATGMVPLAAAAWAEPQSLPRLDALCDCFLLNHVANRASRAQGQAFLLACERAFDVEGVRRVACAVRAGKLAAHWGPVFGATGRELGLPRRKTCRLLLFLSLRGAVSSAVRLGIVGPLEGQKLQHQLAGTLDGLVKRHVNTAPEDVAQTAPLADLLQGAQDRLYSRLFIS